MNHMAVGVGSWLEKRGRPSILYIDRDRNEEKPGNPADVYSYMLWDQARHNEVSSQKQALHALVRELFEQLEPNEQLVLQGIHLEGRSARAVSISMGLHHSAVGRLRLRAEEKLRAALSVAIRLQELEREYSREEW